jgi:glycosyltransferase involved in cell wall biosynthesis
VLKATQVHTISKFSREMIVSKYDVSPHSVHLVPAGIDLQRFRSDHRDEAVRFVKSKYDLKDFLLSVGRLEPRKNHIGLIEAFARVKKTNRKLGPLVIIGQQDFGFQHFLKRITELGLEQDIRVLSNVPDSDLPSFYRAADIFIYPSFAEGFGIPVLEAMACGTPVITSDRTAMPEIVGNGGLLVDPCSVDSMATALQRLVEDRTLAERLSTVGVEIAKQWSWENAAQKYLAALAQME